VTARRISLGGEGNVLYPVLFSFYFDVFPIGTFIHHMILAVSSRDSTGTDLGNSLAQKKGEDSSFWAVSLRPPSQAAMAFL